VIEEASCGTELRRPSVKPWVTVRGLVASEQWVVGPNGGRLVSLEV
jgi:hypothetical protein